jgi:CBS domain-containing protein
MVISKVGSLIVTEQEKVPMGIITERDIIRHIALIDNWDKAFVADIMTKNLIIGLLDDDVEVIMEFMTKNYFRHVPILNEG